MLPPLGMVVEYAAAGDAGRLTNAGGDGKERNLGRGVDVCQWNFDTLVVKAGAKVGDKVLERKERDSAASKDPATWTLQEQSALVL